jgi:hypothetical protein
VRDHLKEFGTISKACKAMLTPRPKPDAIVIFVIHSMESGRCIGSFCGAMASESTRSAFIV